MVMNDSQPSFLLASVAAVLVTYGDRRRFLAATVSSVRRQGVGKIIIVDNGALWKVSEEYNDPNISVVNRGINRGSADGFQAGIAQAISQGSEFIWLLDDDLAPDDGCLSVLLHRYLELLGTNSKDSLAVVAARLGYLQPLSFEGGRGFMTPRKSSFLQFHLCDIGLKIKRRLHRRASHLKANPPSLVPVAMAPYGGLLIHWTLIQTFGLPSSDFVLYMDDHEFTSRITRSGGKIVLVTEAILTELEKSWHEESRSSFHALLSGPAFRVYYTLRNLTYLETKYLTTSAMSYSLNKLIYLSVLWLLATTTGRFDRFTLILRAIRDGAAGVLGICKEYPLP
jgi:GT2 family glycosyltransferase